MRPFLTHASSIMKLVKNGCCGVPPPTAYKKTDLPGRAQGDLNTFVDQAHPQRQDRECVFARINTDDFPLNDFVEIPETCGVVIEKGDRHIRVASARRRSVGVSFCTWMSLARATPYLAVSSERQEW